MKKTLVIFLLTILAIGISQANESTNKKNEISKKEDLLIIYKDQCRWCEKLKDEIIPKPDIQDIIHQKYNLIFLNSRSKDQKIRAQVAKLKKEYRYKGVPTYIRPRIKYMKRGGNEKVFLNFLLHKEQ